MTNIALTLSEQITYSTIRIECDNIDGRRGTGTGFFSLFLEDRAKDIGVPVIITNKHVINSAKNGKLIFTTADADGNPLHTSHYEVRITNFHAGWWMHPDPDVDLCCLKIAPIIAEAKSKGVSLFYRSIGKDLIPTAQQLSELNALEEIIMVGYPNGIWDHINNKPILRKGITATHPNFDYCGKKEILIDAACFPGSSGSPVFIWNQGGYADRAGTLRLGTRIFLLGLLYAGPQYTIHGEIKIIDIPTAQRPITATQAMINLGYVIKAERIIELEEFVKKTLPPSDLTNLN